MIKSYKGCEMVRRFIGDMHYFLLFPVISFISVQTPVLFIILSHSVSTRFQNIKSDLWLHQIMYIS